VTTVLPNPGEALFGPVESLEDSAVGQCINGTANVITNLGLAGFPPERICVRHNTLLLADEETPRCVISHYGFRSSPSEGTNTEQVLHSLVIAAFHWSQGKDVISKKGKCLAAWEQAYKAFGKKPQRTAGMNVNANGGCLLKCDVDSAEALNREAFLRGLMSCYLIIDFKLRLGYSQ
jgi:hypothetical protein